MKCRICGSQMKATEADLPFKLAEHTIVVVRDLPVRQCDQCAEYVLEDPVMTRVDEILENVQLGHEVLDIQFAA